MTLPLISLVVPVYNEEDNIALFYKAVSAVINPLSDRYRFEFVFTDNHSSDATPKLLQELARQDDRVRAYRFPAITPSSCTARPDPSTI